MFEKPKKGWAVDGATAGNPGPSEYRCIDLASGEVIFQQKIGSATNNITEFLAVIHAMAKAIKDGIKTDIYTDSMTALAWVKYKRCNSSLKPGRYTQFASDLKIRGEKFLQGIELDLKEFDVIKFSNGEVLKWFTEMWGEIPADYGRKNV